MKYYIPSKLLLCWYRGKHEYFAADYDIGESVDDIKHHPDRQAGRHVQASVRRAACHIHVLSAAHPSIAN